MSLVTHSIPGGVASASHPSTWGRNEIYKALRPPPKEKGTYLCEAAPRGSEALAQ